MRDDEEEDLEDVANAGAGNELGEELGEGLDQLHCCVFRLTKYGRLYLVSKSSYQSGQPGTGLALRGDIEGAEEDEEDLSCSPERRRRGLGVCELGESWELNL